MKPSKVGSIVVVTNELARSSSPDAAAIIGIDAARGVGEAIDIAALDPSNAGSSHAPASILYGAPSIPSTGSSLAAIDSDLRELLQCFSDDLAAGYFVMSRETFAFLSLLRGSGGGKAFPELAQNQLLGFPVLASSDARQAGGGFIALIDAAEILIADEGESALDVSTRTSLQMSNTPSGAAAAMTSLWATNSTAFKAMRWLRWQRRSANASAYISAINF